MAEDGSMVSIGAMRSKTEARVRALLSNRAEVAEKKIMGALAFLVEGSMCCSVGDAGLLVRIEADDRDELLASPHVTPMKLGARTMRGFVRVAPAGYRTDAALAKWLERGISAGREKRKPRGTGAVKPPGASHR